MENKEGNLAGQMDSDIEMSSLAQEVHVQDERCQSAQKDISDVNNKSSDSTDKEI